MCGRSSVKAVVVAVFLICPELALRFCGMAAECDVVGQNVEHRLRSVVYRILPAEVGEGAVVFGGYGGADSLAEVGEHTLGVIPAPYYVSREGREPGSEVVAVAAEEYCLESFGPVLYACLVAVHAHSGRRSSGQGKSVEDRAEIMVVMSTGCLGRHHVRFRSEQVAASVFGPRAGRHIAEADDAPVAFRDIDLNGARGVSPVVKNPDSGRIDGSGVSSGGVGICDFRTQAGADLCVVDYIACVQPDIRESEFPVSGVVAVPVVDMYPEMPGSASATRSGRGLTLVEFSLATSTFAPHSSRLACIAILVFPYARIDSFLVRCF